MRFISSSLLIILSCLVLKAEKNTAYLSLKLEVERSIKLGNQYLLSKMEDSGSWSDDEHPALTALALTALQRAPRPHSQADQNQINTGYEWLLSQQKDDGGIYTEGLTTYNTSTAIMALLATKNQDYTPSILRARSFLIGQQTDWGKIGKSDNKFDGGIGYGGTYKHSDMSNTHLALEAIYRSKSIALDTGSEQATLNWDAALNFITRCQNLTSTNDQAWASDNEQDKGGFVYFPGDSKAGKRALKDESTALRSYGSMSYAGLLSLIFAELPADDPRVSEVTKWLSENYTVEENPGMEQQGLYYYYQAMAKCLAATGHHQLTQKDGTKIDWRRELGRKLVSVQKTDGSWINETSRWWENDPVLVTAYSVLALEQLHSTM